MVTREQHYVFQAYLRGFSDEKRDTDKFVWVYDKEYTNGMAPKVPKSVSSICYENFYYAQEDSEGNVIPDQLEIALGKVETVGSEIIKKLAKESSQTMGISEEERGQLAFLLGLSFTRVPSFRNGIEAMYKKMVEVPIKNNYLDLKGPSGEDFSEFIEKYGVEIEVKKWVSLRPMISFAQAMGDAVLQKSWQFYQAHPEWSFITSDHPVFFDYSEKKYGLNPYVGPLHPLSEVVFPLRKDLALVCTPGNYGHMQLFKAKSSEVKSINRGMVKAARKYIIADHQSEALARLVQKNKDSEQAIIIN